MGCDHARSVAYYVESMISNKFIGKSCDTYENFKAGKCNRNQSIVMGTFNLDIKYVKNYINPKNIFYFVLFFRGSGKCYLETNDHAPFAKG